MRAPWAPAVLLHPGRATAPPAAVVVNHESSLYPLVRPDREKEGYELVSHLVGLSHRRIDFINGIPGYVSTRDSIAGYRRAPEAAGLDWRD